MSFLRLRSTAMWVIRWLSTSSTFLANRRGRFLFLFSPADAGSVATGVVVPAEDVLGASSAPGQGSRLKLREGGCFRCWFSGWCSCW